MNIFRSSRDEKRSSKSRESRDKEKKYRNEREKGNNYFTNFIIVHIILKVK